MLRPSVQTLLDARELISDRSRWTQGEMARGWPDTVYLTVTGRKQVVRGPSVPVATSHKPACFCSIGAIWHVQSEPNLRVSAESQLGLSLLAAGYEDTSPIRFNDRQTHEDVLRMFDAAIVNASGFGEALRFGGAS